LGAFINRLEATTNNLSISIENQQAAEARVRNVDVAAESSSLVSRQILQQAAASILTQANQVPSLALSLLRG
jgi:flagellin